MRARWRKYVRLHKHSVLIVVYRSFRYWNLWADRDKRDHPLNWQW